MAKRRGEHEGELWPRHGGSIWGIVEGYRGLWFSWQAGNFFYIRWRSVPHTGDKLEEDFWFSYLQVQSLYLGHLAGSYGGRCMMLNMYNQPPRAYDC